ncbi:MAG: F0F1 ATP synthase subunit A, partial [Desulfuromonadales bacterium]|nr:F0F1 ATP synthase subunit A [Desulfuromonadales bacterium]
MIRTVFVCGPLSITATVLTTWLIMAVLWLVAWLTARRLSIDPGPLQSAVEGVVSSIEEAVSAVAPQHARRILPLIGTLWIFLVGANLCGLIPGLHSPTRDLSATAALATVVFLSTIWFGVRIQGVKRYL